MKRGEYMDGVSLAMIGAGFAIGIAAIGSGLGIGIAGAAAAGSVRRWC